MCETYYIYRYPQPKIKLFLKFLFSNFRNGGKKFWISLDVPLDIYMKTKV